MSTRDVGIQWENAALAYMLGEGLKLVERNFLCRYGEIDLILREGDTTVFAEVRYRNTAQHGGGTVSVGRAKRDKLVRAAQTWLQTHARFATLPCRFDVIGCAGTLQQPVFEWTRNAFDAW
jgi:putative endonuclease